MFVAILNLLGDGNVTSGENVGLDQDSKPRAYA